ncbi:EpsG family protein [Pectobacterium punjabense]|uniref:EpsG family protein n=1 Tax=Pectobacterium punjabense TaxID=2108399 RepID=UPI00311DC621
MFVFLLISPTLFFSFFWHRFSLQIKKIFSILYLFFLITLFTGFYLNGYDWSVYYLSLSNDESSGYFEVGFVFLFKAILFVAGGNFGISIFIYYLIIFSSLFYFLNKKNVNLPFFITAMLLVFGYNLILEQLRQFIACVIIFYAVIKLEENRNYKGKYILLCIFSSLFHVSSLVMIPALYLVEIKSSNKFKLLSILAVFSICIFLSLSSSILLGLSDLSFVFNKLSNYIDKSPVVVNFGLLNVIDLFFVIFYLFFNKKIDENEYMGFYARFIFLGALIHFFSGSIPFLSRLSYYFYFVVIYVFSMSVCKNGIRYMKIRDNKTLLVSIFFFVFTMANYTSYFRNMNAPIDFFTMNIYLPDIFYENYVNELAIEKFQSAASFLDK